MLLEYHQGVLGSLSPDKLQEYLKIAEDLKILRQENESDEAYAKRTIKIVQMSSEIPKLFNDNTWDTGSVVDAVTLGLAAIIAENYKDESLKFIDSYTTTLLIDRIRYYRSELSQNPLPEWTDDDVRGLIQKFQMVDRPVGGDESEKISYARRTLKTLRMLESSLVASGATDFDAIEALCIELSVILGKSPLPLDMVKSLVKRIPENVKRIKDNNEKNV